MPVVGGNEDLDFPICQAGLCEPIPSINPVLQDHPAQVQVDQVKTVGIVPTEQVFAHSAVGRPVSAAQTR